MSVIITTKTIRASVDGRPTVRPAPRINAADHLMAVRAFYLDLSQWAAEDPSRWGPWVAPCPIREPEASLQRKKRSHRKSRMDQRTRERLPILPVLITTLTNALRPPPTGARRTSRRRRRHVHRGGADPAPVDQQPARAGKTWAEDPDTGKRRDLSLGGTPSVLDMGRGEVLRHTGMRIEELTELSHHSLIHYRLPATGELVPLLQIAPSKTDTERLLVISPELADVLSAIISRVRDPTGAVPLVTAYDYHERVWNPPMPLLFQRRFGGETAPSPGPADP